MKLIAEKQDIEDVKSILSDYYGIIINDEQSKCLLKNKHLASEIYKYGCHDTETSSSIVNTLVKRITKGYKKTLHYPLNGDSTEYKEEFDVVFKEAAKLANIELDKCWYEKEDEIVHYKLPSAT